MSSSQIPKMITVRTSDDETFEMEEAVACQSLTIKHMIEDGCAGSEIPLPNVTSRIMVKVLDYCNFHAKADASNKGGEAVKEFDQEFFKDVQANHGVLYEMLLASNYLDIKGLLDLVAQGIANMMKGKSPEQIRQLFNIKNDFSPEVEKEVRAENAWAYDDEDEKK